MQECCAVFFCFSDWHVFPSGMPVHYEKLPRLSPSMCNFINHSVIYLCTLCKPSCSIVTVPIRCSKELLRCNPVFVCEIITLAFNCLSFMYITDSAALPTLIDCKSVWLMNRAITRYLCLVEIRGSGPKVSMLVPPNHHQPPSSLFQNRLCLDIAGFHDLTSANRRIISNDLVQNS